MLFKGTGLALLFLGCSLQPVDHPPEPPALYPSTPPVRLKTGPLRVGIQSGHLRMNELPDELARLRDNQGAYAAGIFERDLNLSVAQELLALLRKAGYEVDLLPGTIPPGYEADAVVSLHVDWSFDGRRGWKIAAPWRHSPYAAELKKSLRQSLSAKGWPEDADHVSINMRGYHAFNRRYKHSVDRYTPAVILEMGMMTNYQDRMLLSRSPGVMAQAIFQGLSNYFKKYDRKKLDQFEIPEIPYMLVKSHRALLRTGPVNQGIALLYLKQDERLFPVGSSMGWTEVYVRNRELVGYVDTNDLKIVAFPWPGGPVTSILKNWLLVPDPSINEVKPPLRSIQVPRSLEPIPGTNR